MGECPKCGSVQGVGLACRHVAVGVAAAVPRFDAEFREYGDAGNPALGIICGAVFCRSCLDRLALPPSGMLVTPAVEAAAGGVVEGVCGGCLGRWLGGLDAEPGAAAEGGGGKVPVGHRFPRPRRG